MVWFPVAKSLPFGMAQSNRGPVVAICARIYYPPNSKRVSHFQLYIWKNKKLSRISNDQTDYESVQWLSPTTVVASTTTGDLVRFSVSTHKRTVVYRSPHSNPEDWPGLYKFPDFMWSGAHGCHFGATNGRLVTVTNQGVTNSKAPQLNYPTQLQDPNIPLQSYEIDADAGKAWAKLPDGTRRELEFDGRPIGFQVLFGKPYLLISDSNSTFGSEFGYVALGRTLVQLAEKITAAKPIPVKPTILGGCIDFRPNQKYSAYCDWRDLSDYGKLQVWTAQAYILNSITNTNMKLLPVLAWAESVAMRPDSP